MTGIFRLNALLTTTLLVAAADPLGAHHGTNISYDRSKQFTTQAVVKSFDTGTRIPSCTSISGRQGLTQTGTGAAGEPRAADPQRLERAKRRRLNPGTQVHGHRAPAKAAVR